MCYIIIVFTKQNETKRHKANYIKKINQRLVRANYIVITSGILKKQQAKQKQKSQVNAPSRQHVMGFPKSWYQGPF